MKKRKRRDDDDDDPQLNFFARNSDPDTSHEAAEGTNLTRDRALALAEFELMGGEATANEFRDWLMEVRDYSLERAETLRKRSSDLVNLIGVLEPTGERRDGCRVLRLVRQPPEESAALVVA
jgi:hypothetical protein